MIKHVVKILWSNKRLFSGIIIEQAFVFIILLFCLVSILVVFELYNSPGILDTKNVVVVGCMEDVSKGKRNLNNIQVIDEVISILKDSPNVIAVTESPLLTPYMRIDDVSRDTINIDGQKINVYVKFSDKDGYKVFRPNMEEGTWLINNDSININEQIIISRNVANAARWTNAVGKKIMLAGINYTVVGVISGIKQYVFGETVPAVIISYAPFRSYMPNYREFSLKVKDKTVLMSDYYQAFQRVVSNDKLVPIVYDLDACKDFWMSDVRSIIGLQIVPTLFLFVFVFLGTVGVFFLTFKRRIKEFALKRAVGATIRQLHCLAILEGLIISLIASIPGIILACFVYNLRPVHFEAIVITLFILLCSSIIGSWYPAYSLLNIRPAEILKYE